VVFFVIGDERNGGVVMLNFRAQDVLVPFDHGLKLVSSVDDMSKFIGALSHGTNVLFV
jgi:hypothetical protein